MYLSSYPYWAYILAIFRVASPTLLSFSLCTSSLHPFPLSHSILQPSVPSMFPPSPPCTYHTLTISIFPLFSSSFPSYSMHELWWFATRCLVDKLLLYALVSVPILLNLMYSPVGSPICGKSSFHRQRSYEWISLYGYGHWCMRWGDIMNTGLYCHNQSERWKGIAVSGRSPLISWFSDFNTANRNIRLDHYSILWYETMKHSSGVFCYENSG